MADKRKSENYSNLGGINLKASTYATGINEFLDIKNFDFSRPGALTKRWGSTQYVGATVQGIIGGLYEFERLNGTSFVVFGANTNFYYLSGGAPASVRSGLANNAILDFVTFVDRLFVANGTDFFKFDGSQTTNYGLPDPVGMTFSIGASHANGMSGRFVFSYGYKNDRGYFGPSTNGVTISATSSSQITLSGFTVPSGYGISSMVLYATENNQASGYFWTELPITTATFAFTGFSLSARPAQDYLFLTAAPQSIEIYNNQLFFGITSTLYWSEIGEPEGVLPESNAEIRTNDGDRLTALKSYYSQLLVFKSRSFHSFSGDSPQNFTLRELSDQYGAISPRAVAVYEDKCMFLDRKGVVSFNGANIGMMSNKVDSIFSRMNLAAAATFAQMIHINRRNEVWTAIPIDGATLNNCVVVYDYVVDAWSTYLGFNPASLAIMKAGFDQYYPFFGNYMGQLHNFKENLYGDNGVGMTCSFQTRNYGDLGYSNEKVWRKLYLDVSQQLGSSEVINFDFYVNDGTSLAISRQLGASIFQSNVEFGLSSKTLQFVCSNVSNVSPLKINGYTIEYRFQRAV